MLFQIPSTTALRSFSPRSFFVAGVPPTLLPDSLPKMLSPSTLLCRSRSSAEGSRIEGARTEASLGVSDEGSEKSVGEEVGRTGSDECWPKKVEMKVCSVSALSIRTREADRKRASGEGR